MTPANRKAAERQRRKDAGLVRVEFWIRPEDVQAVKLAVALIVDEPRQDTQQLAPSE